MPFDVEVVREWCNRTLFGCFNSEMSKKRENDSAFEDVNLTPSKPTAESLSKTPKGQLIYDRQPLSPIMITSLDSKSGILLPESVFKREPSRHFEKSFEQETALSPEHEDEHKEPAKSPDKKPLKSELQLQFLKSEARPNHLSWQEELLLMRNTHQFDETTPVYNVSSDMLLKLFERNEVQQLVSAIDF